MPDQEHIVILGSGFAGRYAAEHLAAILPLPHRITLVDRVDHMLYTPMLTEVAGGTVAPENVAVPAHKLPGRVHFLEASIKSVDVHARSVTLATGRILEATQIVLALGSTTSYHDIPGAREHSLQMKTLADAVRARSAVDALVASARSAVDPAERRRLLTLVVAGGGYTGVETMAALDARLREGAAAAGLSPDDVTSILVEPGDRLMSEMPASLAGYSQHKLDSHGVRVLTGVGVKQVGPDSIELTSGEMLRHGLLLWDAGIEPSPLLAGIDVPKGKHHGVTVDDTFRVPGLPGIWALGDCAEIPQPDGKSTYAPTAQNAVREGKQVARNIVAVLKGRPLHPFRYVMLGQLALLGGRNAIADVLGVEVRGFLAWALWWVIYTAKLPDMPRRLAVVNDLTRPSSPRP